MKKIPVLLIFAVLFIFPGCLDTVQESTINNDGSGVFVSTMNMGKLLGMVKMFAGEKEEMKEISIESARLLDSLQNIERSGYNSKDL